MLRRQPVRAQQLDRVGEPVLFHGDGESAAFDVGASRGGDIVTQQQRYLVVRRHFGQPAVQLRLAAGQNEHGEQRQQARMLRHCVLISVLTELVKVVAAFDTRVASSAKL